MYFILQFHNENVASLKVHLFNKFKMLPTC